METKAGETDRLRIEPIAGALDSLLDRLDEYIAEVEHERATALASGDPKYLVRIDRTSQGARRVVELIEEDVLDIVGRLRHDEAQLRVARKGKLV